MDYWLIFQSLVLFVMTWGGTVLDTVCGAVNVPFNHQSSLSRQIHSGVYLRWDEADNSSEKLPTRDFNILEKLRKQNSIKSYRQPTELDRPHTPTHARQRRPTNSPKTLAELLQY